ncbi:MAG: flagellar basal-body MS-ring/collar protein FliF [Eubacteriales bacterium]|nr:flagellar basal-body MS-ring/collar protein FliF [Eubacteriales bacterium]
MEKYFKTITSQLNNFWNSEDKKRRNKILVISGIILFAIIVFAFLVTRTQYTVLYSNLDSKEAGEIYNKLVEMKVDVKPQGSGTILVSKKQEAVVRMQLAAEGYPKSGFNYDYSDKSLGIGATDFDKRKTDRLEIQDRLQKAIKTMSGVQDAIVTISLPDQDSFVLKDDRQVATASVLLVLGNNTLTAKQIKGIEELVAKSVLGLKPENVSIIDSNMNALNANISNESELVNSNFEIENEVRNTLQKRVLSLLEPVFGKDNVVASVNVRLNFDKQVTEVTRFEPVVDDEGIAVSINELKENVSNSTPQDQSGQIEYAMGANNQGEYERVDRTINYEVNQIKEKIDKAQGNIEDITLSILINNRNIDNSILEDVQQIVATAVGVDREKVTVNGMDFEGRKADVEQVEKALKQANRERMYSRIMDIARYVLVLLAAVFLLFIISNLLTKLIAAQRKPAYAERAISSINEANARIGEDFEEVSDEAQEHIIQKQKIDHLISTKPEIAAKQISDWLNEE